MKKTRTFRLDDNTMEMLDFIKRQYNVIQNKDKNTHMNFRSFSNATVIEKLIEKEYYSLNKNN